MPEVFVEFHESTTNSHNWAIVLELYLPLVSTDQVLAIIKPDDWKVGSHLDLKRFLLLRLPFALPQLLNILWDSESAADESM